MDSRKRATKKLHVRKTKARRPDEPSTSTDTSNGQDSIPYIGAERISNTDRQPFESLNDTVLHCRVGGIRTLAGELALRKEEAA